MNVTLPPPKTSVPCVLLSVPLGFTCVRPLLAGNSPGLTRVDSGDYSTAGVPANFDAHQSYTWSIIRPRSAADVGNPNNITPTNTVAQISIVDTATMMTVPLNNTNLNAYARFDDSAWNWGSVPVSERGMFSFVLMPDASNNADRVIAVQYTPVPEPIWILGASAAAGGWWLRRRRP